MGALTHNGEVLQSLPANASQINFDKTGTNLNSTQTEAAIKEVNTKVNANADEIDELKSGLTALENGTKTLLGKLEVSESVQLPAQYKQLYLRVNITDWFNGAINVINGTRILIPFSVGAWACTIHLEIANNEITFASETTVTGTKNSAWTTYVEIYYS